MRILQRGSDLDLAREPLGRDALCQLRRQYLDHDPAVERLVHRDEYSRHSATEKLTLQCIRIAQSGLQLLPEVAHESPRSATVPFKSSSGFTRPEGSIMPASMWRLILMARLRV